ncbi:tetratricopeptide repeat protein [Algoriphagus namhaensis]|uniref:Tetratricopeptide repeat protein n=1 Tax=Algoriphagus namhaensis TaxID=915353 RepID=A0ABV8AUB2_9BACT
MKRLRHSLAILLLLLVLISCRADLIDIEQDFKNGDYAETIDQLGAYLFFHITDVKALHMRARSYEELGQFTEAKADYERIIDLSPEYGLAYAGLGKIAFEAKDYKNAELYFLRAATFEENNFEILYMIGRAQLMNEKYRTAEEFLRMAKDLNPEFGKVHFYIGMTLAFQGDALGAAAAFNSYVRYEPDHLTGRYNRGFALMRAGYLDWALEDFDAVLKASPDHWDAMAKKGHCLQQMGEPEGCTLLTRAATNGSVYAQAVEGICS